MGEGEADMDRNEIDELSRELNDEVLRAYMLPPRDAQLKSWSVLVEQVDELIRIQFVKLLRAWDSPMMRDD